MAADPAGWSLREYDLADLSSGGRAKPVDARALEARAMSIAQAQLMPVLQTGFFMWMMVPDQLNLFAIMFMASMGTAPFRNLLSVGQGASCGEREERGGGGWVAEWCVGMGVGEFCLAHTRTHGRTHVHNTRTPIMHARIHHLAAFSTISGPGVSLLVPKLMFVALNLVGVAVVMYKLRVMGLLPLTSADWVSLLPSRYSREWTSVGED